MNKPSIKKVADFAGVSTATVSHVINGTRFVSDETKEKVNRAIETLGYIPSSIARGLASQKSKIIGVVFSDISNPFFTSVFRGIESLLTEQGYELSLANTREEPATQESVLNTMFSRQIEGLIIAPTGLESPMLEMMIASNIPIVMIDRGGPVKNCSIVNVDNEEAVFAATSHLFEDGHRKIGLIQGLPAVDTTKYRFKGYVKALNYFQLPFKDDYVTNGDSCMEGGYQSAYKLMTQEDPPTAVFTTNNLMTLGALHAFRDLGLQVPKDVGLIGFDDHEWADIFTPPISVIRQPTYKMGMEATRMLLAKMKGEKPCLLEEELTLKAELIIRGSCSEKCNFQYQKTIQLAREHGAFLGELKKGRMEK